MICKQPERGWSLRPSRVPKPNGPVHFDNTPQASIPDMKNKSTLQPGRVGLGRMGANRVRRLIKDGHWCVVFDRLPEAVTGLAGI
jgi:hypothetical protein